MTSDFVMVTIEVSDVVQQVRAGSVSIRTDHVLAVDPWAHDSGGSQRLVDIDGDEHLYLNRDNVVAVEGPNDRIEVTDSE